MQQYSISGDQSRRDDILVQRIIDLPLNAAIFYFQGRSPGGTTYWYKRIIDLPLNATIFYFQGHSPGGTTYW